MAGKHKRGEAWYLSWYEGGKLCRRSLGRVTEAEAEAQRLALEQRADLTPAAGPALADWALQYCEWHAQEYPDSYYRVEQILRSHILPVLGAVPLLSLSREQIEAYKAARKSAGAAAATIIKELRTLQALLNRAVDLDVIPRNPIRAVKPPKDLSSKPPRWYSREELAAIYTAALAIHPSTTAADRQLAAPYRWTWQLLANTGLRRGEALHLKWRDIGKEEIRILSEPGARTKSGKWRAVPITEGAGEALDSLRIDRAPHVIPQIEPASLSRAFARATKRANLDGGIHCLRHTYCSHLVMAGVPLRTVQVLAGHSSMRVTEQYAHLAPSHLRDAVRGLHL